LNWARKDKYDEGYWNIIQFCDFRLAYNYLCVIYWSITLSNKQLPRDTCNSAPADEPTNKWEGKKQ
jgi:hypothetical protein